MNIHPCGPNLLPILSIINAAAEAYRGVIPPDCFHDPYMSLPDLEREVASGVSFWGLEIDGTLQGVMGTQPVRDVDLIRHAYVAPGLQRRGIGGALIQHLLSCSHRRMLVGTWAAAGWAIDFYQRHGFALVAAAETPGLLSSYWAISDRQIQTSVVLTYPGTSAG